jgi:hypothetical protein
VDSKGEGGYGKHDPLSTAGSGATEARRGVARP